MRRRGATIPRRFRSYAFALVSLLLGAALAQATQVTLELGSDRRGRPAITATVTDAEGTPLSRQQVDFSFVPDFFPNAGERLNGSRPVYLGSKTTNVVGQAQLTYAPPYTGRIAFEAVVAGSEARGSLMADVVREEDPSPEPAEIPLAEVRLPLERTILAAVIGLWLLLLTLVGTTLWTIRRRGGQNRGGGAPGGAVR